MKSKQFRISIPADDPQSIDWCENQRPNLSLAMRVLIQKEIKRNGMKNIFATTDKDVKTPAESAVKRNAAKAAKVKPKTVKPAKKAEPETQNKTSNDDSAFGDDAMRNFMM